MARQPVIYLDYAAATPLDPAVRRAMEPYFADSFYNPSATYGAARDVQRALAAARGRLAHWLGARPGEVIFTAGGTEANNLAIHGVMRRFPDANIVVSAIEHESVLEPAGAYDRRVVAVKPDGRLDLEDLARKIDANTVLVSIMYANNEIGTIQPLRQAAKIIAEQCRQRQAKSLAKARPLYFHADACQAANYLDLHVSRLGVDLLTINGGKIYGPKQSGALYVKAGLSLRPLIQGGGQEQGLRSGTENVPAAVGLAAALDLVQSSRHQEGKRLQAIQQQFFKSLQHQIPTAVINGSRKHRLPNNIHLTIPGQDNERLLIQLDQAGILAAAGSACSASRGTPSHVLRALGLSDAEARASLRFTLGRGTTEVMLERCLQVLAKLLP
jgi:cysteine desulfurase